MKYEQFLKSKVRIAQNQGFEIDLLEINPALKNHNRLMVKWLVAGGRRACFASFGLHKTVTQLETVRITLKRTGGRGLIVLPLNVKQEFFNDAAKLNTGEDDYFSDELKVEIKQWHIDNPGCQYDLKFIRRIEEAGETGIYLTNYETIRDGKLDPRLFNVASLDEASVLRGLGGSKTFREFMRLFTGDAGPNGDRRGTENVPYRFVATATPSPNEYIELLAYADFLGIMDVSQAKTRFFKRDSTKADKLTIHAHKEEEFWLWVSSWALFVTKPSDITGNQEDDKGYEMPALDIRWHELPSDHQSAGVDKRGNVKMFRDTAMGLQDAAKEKRDSLSDRVAKMMELREEDLEAHRIIWHDLESERHLIEKSISDVVTIYGSQDYVKREQAIADFSNGKIREFGAKPVIAGSGCNFQRHCNWAIYLGIGFKFNDFIQSIHRLQRFLQKHQVRVDLIYTEAERKVRQDLIRKWDNHNKLVEKMTEIIKMYGLNHLEMAAHLTRKMGVERVEVQGAYFKAVNNDNVLECKTRPSNSVGLILTSIPFSTQYEYSPNYADFGHTANNEEFFQQMDYLTPELFRTLQPGRIAAIHVKDRIVPGGMTGLGFQTVYPFHLHTIQHFIKHGFGYMGMKTIVTDVVRENNQTYRLGWTEQCKDGSKMGVGMPEYLLLFRKPQTDTSKSYADVPVVKNKSVKATCPHCKVLQPMDSFIEHFDNQEVDFNYQCQNCKKEITGDDEIKLLETIDNKMYSRSRWQIDAHGFTRSNGNRNLTPDEIAQLPHDKIYKWFRDFTMQEVYDFEHHVKIGETLDLKGKLPTGFMLLQPQSWTDDVWTDVTRMLTLNGSQWSKGKEMHLCPMQFDIADRVIEQMSNPGDIVYDPFAGLFTVPYRAILKGRIGEGDELNPSYFLDGVSYCKSAESKINVPTLFDFLG